jgi:hypothetical protein
LTQELWKGDEVRKKRTDIRNMIEDMSLEWQRDLRLKKQHAKELKEGKSTARMAEEPPANTEPEKPKEEEKKEKAPEPPPPQRTNRRKQANPAKYDMKSRVIEIDD